MNKKAQFIALLSLFLVVGLFFIYFYLDKGTNNVVRLHYTSADVLNQHFDIKEYLLSLNQKAKYGSFKAFLDLCSNSGFEFESTCKNWYAEGCKPNLEKSFRSYFLNYFDEPFYDIKAEIKNNKFVISGKYQDKKVFELYNARTEFIPEFNYVLDYNVDIFEELYAGCRSITDCSELKNCKANKCDDSSDDNYINMEYDLEDNGFVKPKILFKITKSKKL